MPAAVAIRGVHEPPLRENSKTPKKILSPLVPVSSRFSVVSDAFATISGRRESKKSSSCEI